MSTYVENGPALYAAKNASVWKHGCAVLQDLPQRSVRSGARFKRFIPIWCPVEKIHTNPMPGCNVKQLIPMVPCGCLNTKLRCMSKNGPVFYAATNASISKRGCAETMHSELLLIRIDRTFWKPNVKHCVYDSRFRGSDGKAIVETKLRWNTQRNQAMKCTKMLCGTDPFIKEVWPCYQTRKKYDPNGKHSSPILCIRKGGSNP